MWHLNLSRRKIHEAKYSTPPMAKIMCFKNVRAWPMVSYIKNFKIYYLVLFKPSRIFILWSKYGQNNIAGSLFCKCSFKSLYIFSTLGSEIDKIPKTWKLQAITLTSNSHYFFKIFTWKIKIILASPPIPPQQLHCRRILWMATARAGEWTGAVDLRRARGGNCRNANGMGSSFTFC